MDRVAWRVFDVRARPMNKRQSKLVLSSFPENYLSRPRQIEYLRLPADRSSSIAPPSLFSFLSPRFSPPPEPLLSVKASKLRCNFRLNKHHLTSVSDDVAFDVIRTPSPLLFSPSLSLSFSFSLRLPSIHIYFLFDTSLSLPVPLLHFFMDPEKLFFAVLPLLPHPLPPPSSILFL